MGIEDRLSFCYICKREHQLMTQQRMAVMTICKNFGSHVVNCKMLRLMGKTEKRNGSIGTRFCANRAGA